jgi:hypothetical protein
LEVLRDDSLAEALSMRGRKTAERYDVARVAEEELEVILRRLRAKSCAF